MCMSSEEVATMISPPLFRVSDTVLNRRPSDPKSNFIPLYSKCYYSKMCVVYFFARDPYHARLCPTHMLLKSSCNGLDMCRHLMLGTSTMKVYLHMMSNEQCPMLI